MISGAMMTSFLMRAPRRPLRKTLRAFLGASAAASPTISRATSQVIIWVLIGTKTGFACLVSNWLGALAGK